MKTSASNFKIFLKYFGRVAQISKQQEKHELKNRLELQFEVTKNKD